jgi:MFS family permease
VSHLTSTTSLTTSLTPRETFLSLGSAIVSVTIVGIGLSLTLPLLALRLDEQGFSARAIGFNSAAGGLAVLLGAGAVPALVRRLGIKRLLVIAILFSCISLLNFALTNNSWAWLGIRAIFGSALSALFVTSEFWINAVAPSRQRGFVLGFYATSLAAGFAAGPMILGFTGTAGTLPFIAGMALFALAAAPIVSWSGKAPDFECVPKTGFLVILKGMPLAAFAGLLHGAVETASLGLLPIYALRAGENLETGALLVSLFSLGNVLFQLPIGFVSDHMGRGRLLVFLASLSLCGAIALAVAGPGRFLFFCCLLVIWGGVVGSLYAVGLAYLGSRYRDAELASANAAFIMLYALGMIFGPPVVGFGMDLISPNGLFFSIAALLVLYLSLAWWCHARISTG